MGELIISGGGSTAVATAELFEEAARLGSIDAVLAGWGATFGELTGRLEALAPVVDSPMQSSISAGGLGRAAADLRSGGRAVETANERARQLRAALVEAGERYGAAEASIDHYARLGGQVAAWALGFSLHVLPLVTVQAIAAGAAAIAFARGDDLDDVLQSPEFVSFVATAVDSVDEVAGGALLVPPGVTVGAGHEIRAPESASLLLGAAGLVGAVFGSRVLVDGQVSVRRQPPDGRAAPPAPVHQRAGGPAARTDGPPLDAPVAAPTGVADLIERIPLSDADAQIRVERYGDATDPRWVVYIGGTVDFTTTAGAETNDMTSNVHGIADDSAIDALRLAGADSAAVDRAARLALADAGAKPGDPIVPIGYSGGGAAAAGLAADPELNVVAAVSVGGPVASAVLPDGRPLLSIEHEEDLVPATGGWGHPSPDRLTVSRSVLEAGAEYDAAVPAHELFRYRETAALVDGSEEERLVAFREQLVDFTGGGPGEMSRWIATRELSPSTPGGAPSR
ncbi:hypothetical protein [Agromyces cerinus]|uniref:Alpha/beta hydrolase n=1 Tax=Agromyces cerinus subsp. cerinus TaxID=232089 RepID=A0A1N6G1G4_9MICO|nr:hypothetical protein [Agromyces cerinus]SIO01358.1 hypothetical protein SAMN05443544_2215 [Agromyces cerinus subsp. cerinus]